MSFRTSIFREIEKVKREARVACRRLGFGSQRAISRDPWVELDYFHDHPARSAAARARKECLYSLLVLTDPICAVDQGGYTLGELAAQVERDLKTLRTQLPKAAPRTPASVIAQWQREMESTRRVAITR
jgi:hypothetical protein